MTPAFGRRAMHSNASFRARFLQLRDGRAVSLRAARPADAEDVQRFVRGLSQDSRRNRFFSPVRELTRDQLDRVIRTRDPNDLTLVAATMDHGPQIVALAQHAMCEAGNAEFAVVV